MTEPHAAARGRLHAGRADYVVLRALYGATLALLACLVTGMDARGEPRFQPLEFSEIPGWTSDGHGEAFATFRLSCRPILAGDVKGGSLAPRIGQALAQLCRQAQALGDDPGDRVARAFFEEGFRPYRISSAEAARGFVTAYFEPAVNGALAPDARYRHPLYAAPPDLVPLGRNRAVEGTPAGLEAARRTPEGLVPYPTRAEIEAGALQGQGLELVWLESPVDAFYVHIQGSARILLPDGDNVRVTFAAKNGHPYTAIGRVLIERGVLTRETAGMAAIRAWLEANPQAAREVMNANRSFIFFALDEAADPALGPSGAQGVPLTPGRSLAVDHSLHVYGTPVWIDADLPDGAGTRTAFRRLMVAQDTGSAIVGPARGDLFLGLGTAAGTAAGEVREPADFVALLPRAADLGASR